MLILLEQLADRGPLVLIVEDAHWADRSTRDLLEFLIRNQRTIGGLLIVVTYRSDDLHRTHPLRPMLAELGRVDWVRRIDLGRLNRADTDELVARITGSEPREDAARAVYRRTEGNPLFVEALIGDGEPDSGLPESLRDLLIAGVRRLPEPTQDVVRIASAGGKQVGHALLAAVVGLDDTALARALRPAVAADVVLCGADGYSFRHALIREAVHDELLPGERGGLHGRFARAIEGDPLLVPPGRAAVERAYHWYAALDPGWALISAWQAAGAGGRGVARGRRRGSPAGRSRPPSSSRCSPGCSSCGTACPTPPTGSAPTTWGCWRRRSAPPSWPGSMTGGWPSPAGRWRRATPAPSQCG